MVSFDKSCDLFGMKKGEILFSNGEYRQYALVEPNIHIENAFEFLHKLWNLKKPSLLISLTGCTDDINLESTFQEVFRKGLVQLIRRTGVWIISSCESDNLGKYVGRVVRDYQQTVVSSTAVVTIGIESLGCISQGQKLQEPKYNRTRENWIAYNDLNRKEKDCKSYLDSNTTHFLFVNNNADDIGESGMEFRTRLEKKISLRQLSSFMSDTNAVPAVLLVIDGGFDTLQKVYEYVENDLPVVVISGTGHVADVLAFAFQNSKCKDDKNQGNIYTLSSDALAKMERLLSDIPDITNVAKARNTVEDIIRNKAKFITICPLTSTTRETTEIDVAIISALLKAKADHMAQLELTMMLNRSDIARSIIIAEGICFEEKILQEISLKAVLENKVEFVKVFFEMFDVKSFLSQKMLADMYSSTQDFLFPKLLKKLVPGCKAQNITLQHVGKLIQCLLGDFYTPHYLVECEDPKHNATAEIIDYLQEPFLNLFIWSVLMNYSEMAKYFWRQDTDKIINALMAYGLLRAMSKHVIEKKLKADILSCSREFNNLAIEGLNECYETNPKQTHDLLRKNHMKHGDVTATELASSTKNQTFFAQIACQSLLSEMWRGGLSLENNIFKVVICVAIPPLVPRILDFKESKTGVSTDTNCKDNQCSPEEKNEQDERNHISICEKMRQFYTSPMIVFIHYVLSYVSFVGILGYVLLIDLHRKFTIKDGILSAMMVAIFTEEIRQVITSPSNSAKQKLKDYLFRDLWNLLDVVIIVLFTTGMGIRYVPYEWGLEAARVILAIDLLTLFWRILVCYSANKKTGPKVIMIRRMFIDLMYFAIIFMVFVIAYGIASYSILYPNSELDIDLVFSVFKSAYWNLYGELFLEELEREYRKEPECTFDPDLYNSKTLPRCPSVVGTYATPFMMGLYVLLSNLLLLNILIAMFSFTFRRIEENADLHWSFQRYYLVRDHCERPPFPPPLIVLCHIKRSFDWVIKKYCKKCLQNEQDSTHERNLRKWEQSVSDSYLERKRIEDENPRDKDSDVHDRLNELSVQVHDRLNELSKQIEAIATILSTTIQPKDQGQQSASSSIQ